MRNLIAFYLRFRIFLVFVILQIIALSLVVKSSQFPRLQFLTTVSEVSTELLIVRNDVTKHFNLSNTNKKLQQENKKLREELGMSKYQKHIPDSIVNDLELKQNYTYIPATVINSTFDKRNNYMTISVGWREGVKRQLGVFSSKGIVGIVAYVGEHYSLVKIILSKDINLDVMLEKGGAFGLLKWDGLNARYGTVNVSNDLPVKKWSKVVTRGGSGIFPRGIPVGKVQRKSSVEGKPLWDVTILFAEDFRTIQDVYVVKNLMIQEIIDVEKHIPEDKEEEDL